MKHLALTLLITLASSLAFASGGGGGGGWRPGTMMMTNPGLSEFGGTAGGGVIKSPEIVFHMGQKNGLVKFAYGQLSGNQWQIQKIQIPEFDLVQNPNIAEALMQSQQENNWTLIK
ncbi:MAG: hypothetical protein ACKOX6_16640 [Bdellovibrio sp.]